MQNSAPCNRRLATHLCRSESRKVTGRTYLAAMSLLAVLTLVGCGPRTMPVSDVDQATALITQTFDDWKAGATLDAQRDKSPPVYVAEELWLDGAKLKDYELTAPGEVFGTNIRFRVKLKCADSSGATKDRELKYLVTTTPARTIAREDR